MVTHIETIHESPLFAGTEAEVDVAERDIFTILLEAVFFMRFTYFGWPDKGDFSDEQTLILEFNSHPYLKEALEALPCEVQYYDDEPCEPPVWAIRHSTCEQEVHDFFVKLWKLTPHKREIK